MIQNSIYISACIFIDAREKGLLQKKAATLKIWEDLGQQDAGVGIFLPAILSACQSCRLQQTGRQP